MKLEDRKCSKCQKLFTPKKRWQVICSKSCGSKHLTYQHNRMTSNGKK